MSSRQATTGVETEPTLSKSSRRPVAVVVAIVFIDLLGFGIIIPVLPFYVRSFGVSDVFIGLLAASYSLAQFVAAPMLGRISDERGRRPILMLSVGVAGIAWLVFGVAAEVGATFGTALGLVVLFSARLLAGAAGGHIAAAQGSAFGFTQAAGSLGRTIGPPVAAAAYVAIYWSPFIGGALLLVPVGLLLRAAPKV